MAAVLACGPDAVLSHRSAGALHELLRSATSAIDVTVPARTRRGRRGITFHHTRNLESTDRTKVDGVLVTTVARTLLDLATVLQSRRLQRALEEADRRELLNFAALTELLDRNRGRPGVAGLRALLQIYAPVPAFTRSELERRFRALCRKAGLPLPAMNMFVAGCEVDAAWLDCGLIVEIDTYELHGSRRAFEDDRARDGALQLAGYHVLRVTDQRLLADPAGVVDEIARFLNASSRGVASRSAGALRSRRCGS
jgi:hypothetical protein